jgi:hypothetical protein
MGNERSLPIATGTFTHGELTTALETEVFRTVPELAALAAELRHQLMCDLADAVAYAKAGLPTPRPDLRRSSDRKLILAADVEAAITRVGLSVAVWSREAEGKGTSVYVRVLRSAGKLAGLRVPARPFELRKEAKSVTRSTGD